MITQEQIRQGTELMSTLITKAQESSSFKEQLLVTPEDAIRQIVGDSFKVPKGKKFVVEDQTDESIIYFNVPSKPNLDEIELTDDQLEMVSGGDAFLAASLIYVGLGAGACIYLIGEEIGKRLAQ